MNLASARSLRQLQRWFVSVSTNPEGPPSGAASGAPLERLVTRGPRLSAAERLAIYHDGYYARLEECLKDDYPALAYALGDERFSELSRAYVDQHPSRSPSLNRFGQAFARFCRDREEPWSAFAADLARLEWALVEIVHEAAAPPLTQASLSALPQDRLGRARLLPNEALRLVACDYPVNVFYQSFRDGALPERPSRSPSVVLVYRQGLSLWRQELEPRAALLLQDLMRGSPLDQAIASLELRYAGDPDLMELPNQVARWLGSWIAGGLFRAVELA
jgi:hypothetical protein